jgi:hypothetical protein
MSKTSIDPKDDQVRKSILWSVARISEDECAKVGAAVSRETIAALSQFVYHFAKNCLASDMEQFARHRSQKTRKNASVDILPEDVLLCARKSPSTVDHLISFQKQLRRKRPVKQKQVPTYDDDSSEDDIFDVLKDAEDEDDSEEEPKKKRLRLKK